MSRNVESRFAINPTNIDIGRSKFGRNSSVKFSFNVGDLIPFYVDEVLPGDTFSIKTSKVVRMQPLVTPIMDNLYCDTYYFFVPNRLVWEHWKQFMGENTESAWLPSTEYSVPQIEAPSGGWNVGTIADYMGIPTGVADISVNALPFRSYALICSEWFRDESLSDPLVIPVNDTTVVGVNTGSFVNDVAKGGLPYKAAKYHDYFTSALPAPQKGPDVSIPVGQAGPYPVVTGDLIDTDLFDNSNTLRYYGMTGASGSSLGSAGYVGGAGVSGSSSSNILGYGSEISNPPPYPGGSTGAGSKVSFLPANLWAIDSGGATAATINALRLCFQIQRLYEKDARGGTRYIEILKSHFGVTSPDSRLQRPEYLGGNRIPIHINQVLQQSATESGTTPQGNPAAISLTSDVHGDFSHSFTEHGWIIGLMVVRYPHTYQQGIERMWSRTSRFDYYWPVLANIGEQGIKNKEIFVQGSSVVDTDGNVIDDQIFGYQEAWAEYRYKPNRVAGEMRSAYAQSLDVWHLADDYNSLPSLSSSWIMEDKAPIDRVLAITSSVSNQLFADVFIENTSTRAMPLYSIPGLIDHH